MEGGTIVASGSGGGFGAICGSEEGFFDSLKSFSMRYSILSSLRLVALDMSMAISTDRLTEDRYSYNAQRLVYEAFRGNTIYCQLGPRGLLLHFLAEAAGWPLPDVCAFALFPFSSCRSAIEAPSC